MARGHACFVRTDIGRHGPFTYPERRAARIADGQEHVLALPVRSIWRIFLRTLRQGATRLQRGGLLHMSWFSAPAHDRPAEARGQILRTEPGLSSGFLSKQ